MTVKGEHPNTVSTAKLTTCKGVIVIVILVVVAQVGAAVDEGVKVYVPVVVLFIEGDQLPSILFVEVDGNAGIFDSAQYGPACVNVGVVNGLIVIVCWVEIAQVGCAVEFGVNVYVVVLKLLIAGDQVPAIPLFEVFGRAEKVEPMQYGPT